MLNKNCDENAWLWRVVSTVRYLEIELYYTIRIIRYLEIELENRKKENRITWDYIIQCTTNNVKVRNLLQVRHKTTKSNCT